MKRALSYHVPFLLLLAAFSMPAMAQSDMPVPVLDRRAEWEAGKMLVREQKEEPVMVSATDSITFSGKVRYKHIAGIPAPMVIINAVHGEFLEFASLDSKGYYKMSIAKKDITGDELEVSIGGGMHYTYKIYKQLPVKDAIYNAKVKPYKRTITYVHVCPSF